MSLPRRFYALSLLSVVTLLAAEPPVAPVSPEAALARLKEGNARFISGECSHPRQTPARRAELAAGQTPFAVILTCADSRVSPELIFDQGLGDLFVLRNAGNVVDDHVLGSIEYAIEHLHVTTIVVVGHGRCGAVTAAAGGGHVPGHIRSIVESIEPAVEAVKQDGGDVVDHAIHANEKRVAEILRRVEPVLAHAVKQHHVQVFSAHYDIATGEVQFNTQP
jgi:carbonic anhydrase